MAQLFSPPWILALRLAFGGAVLAVAAAWVTLYLALPAHSGAVSPRQPIPFSHKHHAGDDGIDCRYCHYSVEKAAFAGIPSSEVCLTCHSQLYNDAAMLAPLRESARTGRPIAWTRVHDLPDFVYFNHSIHIARGFACARCHGEVDRMPRIVRVASLEMQWCVGCHREQARALNLDERRLTDCSTCHR